MKLRSNPCNECPFTSKAMSGYAGPYEDIQELIEVGLSDVDYPCHMDHQKGKTSLCNGAIGLMNNECKLPRAQGDTHKALMDHVSHPSVFNNTEQMLEFHEVDIS